MSIAKNIKSKRENIGMTQAQLADAVGVDPSMICKIERGTQAPSMPLGKQISDVLGCTLNDLCED